MRLWIRRRRVEALDFDTQAEVTSQAEWQDLIDDPAVVSSVLWPSPPTFTLAGRNYLGRSHSHERRYTNNAARNLSYRDACRRLADRLRVELAGARCLVWAPLRGALPIWRAMAPSAAGLEVTVHYPVTSSFVFYPERFGIRNRKGRPASGKTAHRLELARVKAFLDAFDALVYVDEIVSGSSMRAHLLDMLELGVDRHLAIVAVGLADRRGERSELHRRRIEGLVADRRLRAFLWEGCDKLITEDQRYLLGIHYVDYALGPNVVPMLDEGLQEFPEKREFERDVLAVP
jgi:hypothetical protein